MNQEIPRAKPQRSEQACPRIKWTERILLALPAPLINTHLQVGVAMSAEHTNPQLDSPCGRMENRVVDFDILTRRLCTHLKVGVNERVDRPSENPPFDFTNFLSNCDK